MFLFLKNIIRKFFTTPELIQIPPHTCHLLFYILYESSGLLVLNPYPYPYPLTFPPANERLKTESLVTEIVIETILFLCPSGYNLGLLKYDVEGEVKEKT